MSNMDPAIDARLATAYTFAPTASGLFKVEAGYKAVYIHGSLAMI